MRRVLAVLGGSFDPPHVGHALLPGWVLGFGGADEVLVAPCWDHALGKSLTPFETRMAWVRAAMSMYGHRVHVSDIEARLAAASGGQPSYSLALLEAVAREHPTHEVRLVVGSDIIETGETARWHRWPDIEARFSPIVVPRAGYTPPGTGALPQVSSTQVRDWLDREADDPEARAALERAVPRATLALIRGGIRGRVWLVGSGHVAKHAAMWLRSRGFAVQTLGARGLGQGEPLPEAHPDGIWVLVGDPHIPAVAEQLAARIGERPELGRVPVLHAAGAIVAHAPAGLEKLRDVGVPVGALHPICALRKERETSLLERASFGYEGDPAARAFAEELLGDQPRIDLQGLDDAGRIAYHGACALAANHLAVIRQAALTELTARGVSDQIASTAIDVLMTSSLDNLQALGVPLGVTGPVARGDLATVRAHLDAFETSAAEVYRELSERLRALLNPGG